MKSKISKCVVLAMLGIALSINAMATPPAKQQSTWSKVVAWWNDFYPHLSGVFIHC